MPHSFAVGDGAAIEKLFADQLRCLSPSSEGPVWRGRTVALVGSVAPALVWLRDRKGIRLDFEAVRFAIDLRWITKAVEGIVLLREAVADEITETDVRGELPDHAVSSLRAYLSEIPGYDPAMPLDQQTRLALGHHNLVLLSFSLSFKQHHFEA